MRNEISFKILYESKNKKNKKSQNNSQYYSYE